MEPSEANVNNNQFCIVKGYVICVWLAVMGGQVGTHPFIPSQEGKLNCCDFKLFLKRLAQCEWSGRCAARKAVAKPSGESQRVPAPAAER